MGYEKFLRIAVDIFTEISCERFLGISADSQERFLGISADFPQNCYLGRIQVQEICMSKISRLLLDNLFRILVQNLPALEELNSKKHLKQPFDFCEIAQNL